ncbi:hypothetical protein SEEH1831_23066 [Salmonella enterica subsp. enterica serovar Heidelberg str. 77-1831]|nr:hypothetical protein SEEH3374_19100 [Salmonella enterica subsp. enterica serovar Heidelberg str. RI-11-013374]KJT83569.1 hypothetical protein SEEH3547_06078 [Salmonella enterica subsp. enterica serovar Heidelberg str. 75-3547]KJT89153.1 hypothetical protein SEEH0300_15532 [Salmonella enterica subsp. enterica serovar Heidelberg str. 76-0300]KJT97721.1 hypothetical protein SEEH1831_23066 [Salmonella enterica subsp. enterica serovar Heidelberg str. 77-1831]
MKCVDGTKSLQYRDVIIKIDNGFIILLLLDGCQMEVFNIFSFSPDKIQFWQYTHIYCIGKLLILFLMTNEMEFCIFTTFYYPRHGYFASIDGIMFHTKKLLTAMTWSLVLSGLKDERQYTFSPHVLSVS